MKNHYNNTLRMNPNHKINKQNHKKFQTTKLNINHIKEIKIIKKAKKLKTIILLERKIKSLKPYYFKHFIVIDIKQKTPLF